VYAPGGLEKGGASGNAPGERTKEDWDRKSRKWWKKKWENAKRKSALARSLKKIYLGKR